LKDLEKKWISAVCDTTETTYVFFTTLVRDQEVEGSNPFAPTTPKILPFNGLRDLFGLHIYSDLWTSVDQLKAKSDAFCPFLTKCNIVL